MIGCGLADINEDVSVFNSDRRIVSLYPKSDNWKETTKVCNQFSLSSLNVTMNVITRVVNSNIFAYLDHKLSSQFGFPLYPRTWNTSYMVEATSYGSPPLTKPLDIANGDIVLGETHPCTFTFPASLSLPTVQYSASYSSFLYRIPFSISCLH